MERRRSLKSIGGVSLRALSGSVKESVAAIRGFPSEESSSLSKAVSDIISLVKSGGDASLLSLSEKYDRVSFSEPRELFASEAEVNDAKANLTSLQISALKKEYQQVAFLARKQRSLRFGRKKLMTPFGYVVTESYAPLDRVGGYVPGGLASYPSTVIMICATAREAGVKDIVLSTPPRKDGRVNSAVLAAASICGVKQVIKLGGAQAIAALAYGTESIKKVELIAGPGNQYVTEAKRQVSSDVSIDSLAGPTELLVVADRDSDPRIVFEDIISQAEHGNRTLCGVVSDSAEFLASFEEIFSQGLEGRKRQDQIEHAFFFTMKTSGLKESLEFASEFAPEHVEVQVKNPKDAETIRAGLVLVGKYAPCSGSDYVVGTNHILPTGGLASRSSGVSVETFLRRVTRVDASEVALKKSLKTLSVLADMEGLPNHYEAAKSRFNSQ